MIHYFYLYILNQNIFLLKKIYTDATFKITPKSYYQAIIIIAKDPNSIINVPCFYIPMSSKQLFLYNKIFESIINILNDENIEYNFNNTYVMCDFGIIIENL